MREHETKVLDLMTEVVKTLGFDPADVLSATINGDGTAEVKTIGTPHNGRAPWEIKEETVRWYE